jgi:putative hydrolase of the HAD superfamily
MIEAVTFDANRTLFAPRSAGAEYARVLARHGVELPERELGAAIAEAWAQLACAADPARDRFGAHAGGARGFWRHLIERAVELAGGERPSPFAAAELYERFAGAGPWQVYDDVRPALAALAGAGLRLAVISNFDERLPRLLESLDLAAPFEVIVWSQAAGVEKPHPRIFEVAIERLGVAPARALHVGDRVREDVEGALGAGMAALRIDRAGGGDVAALTELPARLATFA